MSLISWGIASLYDRIMSRAERACLGQWRQELLFPLRGRVLEIGAGTGINLAYYPPSVTSLILAEPDRNMRRRLAGRLLDQTRRVEVIAATAEQLPFPDNSFDAIVSTLVYCSVQSPAASLKEAWRVLAPGGKLALIEHVGAIDNAVLCRWQRRVEPFWKRCAGNCHLTRDTLASLRSAGFACEAIRRDTLHGAIWLVEPIIRGIAEKP